MNKITIKSIKMLHIYTICNFYEECIFLFQSMNNLLSVVSTIQILLGRYRQKTKDNIWFEIHKT